MEQLENDNIITRLTKFIGYTALSNSQFADKAGIPRPTLSQLLHGRNKSVNDLLLRKLHDGFPELNVSWLLFGVGDMLTDVNIEISKPQNRTDETPSNVQQPKSKTIESLFEQDFDIPVSESIDAESVKNSVFSTIEANKRSDNATRTQSGLSELPQPGFGKKIKSIIVLYTDSSFEIFSPDKHS